MTVDVDVYDNDGVKVPIDKLPGGSPIKLSTSRLKDKDTKFQTMNISDPLAIQSVVVKKRMDLIQRRNRAPIIYHQATANKSNSVIFVEMRAYNQNPGEFEEQAIEPPQSLAVMAKFGSMMSVSDCQYIAKVKTFNLVGDKWYDWFIDRDKVGNDTGEWYFGVVSLKNPDHPTFSKEVPDCQGFTQGDLNTDFGFQRYEMRIFTGGCYYFNDDTEEWEGRGVSVQYTDNVPVQTQCQTDHLTSFGTGFFKTANAIDFAFIFADFDFADHTTVFIVLLVFLMLFIVVLIWAQLHDMKDVQQQKPHWMSDNLAEDHYFYEVIVQTGPMLSHGTESKVQFILTGEENETSIRTLSEPSMNFFKKGAEDTFLMSVDRPLGPLMYLRIWHDNSGLREMQPWHLSYVIIHDLQTGEKSRFFADKWLAIDRDDMTSEVQLGVSMPDGELEFGYLFKQGLFKFLNDDHILWSVFSRPVRSRFTRVQRCFACGAAVFMSMMNNAIW